MNKLLYIALLSSVLSGCFSTNEKEAQQQAPVAKMPNATVESSKEVDSKMKEALKNWQIGTVQFINIEGGFYGIITKDGKKLLPMNLDKNFRQHGAVVKITGKPEKGIVTIQQWGTPFTIKDISLISAGKKSTDPAF